MADCTCAVHFCYNIALMPLLSIACLFTTAVHFEQFCFRMALLITVNTDVQVKTDTSDFDSSLIFEQDPVQIIDALLPLYLNSTLLRALQESLACELAARMNAMSSASDNAKDLKKRLNLSYNRQRQAAITGQIIEICSGASA